MADGIVRAAGGVVWRTNGNNTVEILLVHRPGEGYDDWTFPKGKRDDIDSSEALFVKCGKKLVTTANSGTKLLASITSTAKVARSVCVTGP
jgi:8-oxo-dGTP pyrophosphatase MutT (NUDIX family)